MESFLFFFTQAVDIDKQGHGASLITSKTKLMTLSVIFFLSSCVMLLTLYTRRLALNIKKKKLDIPETGSVQTGLTDESEILVSKYNKYPRPLKVTPMVRRKLSRITSMAQKQMTSEINEIKSMSRTIFSWMRIRLPTG